MTKATKRNKGKGLRIDFSSWPEAIRKNAYVGEGNIDVTEECLKRKTPEELAEIEADWEERKRRATANTRKED
jgi:hypothetical protein